MIVDGKQIASEILATTKQQVAGLGRVPVVRAITVSPNAATESYLRIKAARAADAGMQLDVLRLPDTATTEDVIAAVRQEGTDAVIVQLPLPAGIDTGAVLDAVPAAKDADVLSHATRKLPGALLPPVAAAVQEILDRAGCNARGKYAVVVGQGWLVGDPVAAWLRTSGADVHTLTRESSDLSILKNADTVVSGAGSPHLIKPEMLKPGVVLIDAGTSESDGALAGDADPACAEVASIFTPVPGGVGPIAVACLFRNAAILLTKSQA
ncbi:MAG TPA: bifunctional 5,10-methylenetetrahydrofolate dehydrogenase/5,10-methenyltetrahydrofolate cyclohydrolase [Candidatus Paceibacterota bacterium]|nr:bifunctional 5,10-methylenetetrahydrofolate dehydrogenase/5,10-methenyltetrahydrofolate cyclohydrolase [Candidatus Paceibacterota bacterium]